ncbi:MAG TPA: hypothetical protein VIA06_04840 [Candidatus Dormibacteraeota bacterium]|nr:hypothetical protein [Candidatus Dormibacteraeota bacterium]
MGRYRPEAEGGSIYVIRDARTGDLVMHSVLMVPERFRSEQRAWRRIEQLEGRDA